MKRAALERQEISVEGAGNAPPRFNEIKRGGRFLELEIFQSTAPSFSSSVEIVIPTCSRFHGAVEEGWWTVEKLVETTDPNAAPERRVLHLPPLQIEIIYGQLCAGESG